MAKISETGHAVNISNFKLVIDNCNSYGVAYKPSATKLTIANMTTLWVTGDTAHQALTEAIQNSKNPINEREILFQPAGKLVTRAFNYFKSTDASDAIKQDAKGLADKFRGFKVEVKKLDDGTEDPNDVSKSHLSYVQKGDTFRQLVDLFESDSNYDPNEADLKISALRTLSDQMKTLNDNIGIILAPIETARITRNNALYAKVTGMVDVAQACKDYVVGLYGATSSQAKTIKKIKFVRI
jgi:hypothetical protein